VSPNDTRGGGQRECHVSFFRSVSKISLSLKSIKILRPKVTKILKILLKKFCEFTQCAANFISLNLSFVPSFRTFWQWY